MRTFRLPPKPLNVSGTLVSGGNLLANTTYYFKVVGRDYGNNNTTRYSLQLNQTSPQIYSPYSDTFSITTTTTHKSVALTRTASLKRNGITAIDGYEILMSTSDDFETNIDGDRSRFIPSQTTYFQACTVTNSYTVTSIPLTSYTTPRKKIPYGIPYCERSGASTCTFKSLYDTMKANPTYAIFADKITTFDEDNTLAYRFFGYIIVNRFTGDSASGVYSFTSIGETVFICGGLNVTGISAMKYRIEKSMIALIGSTHNGSSNLFQAPSAGSIVKGAMFRHDGGSKGIIGGKSRAGTGQMYVPTVSPNLDNFGNLYLNRDQTAEHYNIPATIMSSGGGSYMDLHEFWVNYYTTVATGRQKKIITNQWLWTASAGGVFGYDVTLSNPVPFQNLQNSLCSFIDCIWRFRGVTGITDKDDRDFYLGLGGVTYGKAIKNSIFFFGKTISILVKDQNGNILQNAKVTLRNKNGVNITRPANSNGVARLVGGLQNANTFDEFETTIRHDSDVCYLNENTQITGTISPASMVGKTYWRGAEKIKILERRSGVVDPLHSFNIQYKLERGVDGTPVGWLLTPGATNYAMKFVEAPEFLLTDASGKTQTMGIFRVYKFLTHTYGGYLSQMTGAQSTLYNRGDLELTVEKEGYETQKIIISEITARNLGTDILSIEIAMKQVIRIKNTIDGDILAVMQPEKGTDATLYSL